MSKTNGRESLIPRANREAINVQARYLDGNDSPEDHVEGHLGPHGDLLVQGDLDGDAEHCPVLNKDWERLDAHQVKSERLRTAICNKIWLQYLSIFDKMLVCSVLLMTVDNVMESGVASPNHPYSPQNPYSTSVGGARRLSRRSFPETDATAARRPSRRRAKSLMLPKD